MTGMELTKPHSNEYAAAETDRNLSMDGASAVTDAAKVPADELPKVISAFNLCQANDY